MSGDEDWIEAAARYRPDIDALLPVDKAREFDPEESLRFFQGIAELGGELEIGLSLGWSPAMVKRFVSDPERAELIAAIREAGWESLERSFVRWAHAGNATAMKMVAYNKMAHRGWADRRQVSVSAESRIEVVLSVGEALEKKTRELVTSNGMQGVAALQAAFLDDVIEAEIVEP